MSTPPLPFDPSAWEKPEIVRVEPFMEEVNVVFGRLRIAIEMLFPSIVYVPALLPSMNKVPSALNSHTGQLVVHVSVRLSAGLSQEEKTAVASFHDPTRLAAGAGSLCLLQLKARNVRSSNVEMDPGFIVGGLIHATKEAVDEPICNDGQRFT